MLQRITFLLIAMFWMAMNVLLWRAEYDSHGKGLPVPPALVWRKILTAPDISSLNVFQGGQRTGFCEFSTSVERQMATLDEAQAVPKNISSQATYQIRFNGNVSLSDYTNRLTFNGQMEFSHRRSLREINVKLSSHAATIEIHCRTADRNIHLKITSDGVTEEQEFSFADLENPEMLFGALPGDFGQWSSDMDLPLIFQMPTSLAQNIHWEAHLDRVALGSDSVPAYRLETRVLDHPIVIYVSTLGEILRVKLPGDITAAFDQLGNP